MSNSTLLRTKDAQRLAFEILTEDRVIDIQDAIDVNLVDAGELFALRLILAQLKRDLAQAFVDASLPQGPTARRHGKCSRTVERQA
jgi:hypothetical protein